MEKPLFSAPGGPYARPASPFPPPRRGFYRRFFGWISGFVRFMMATVLFFILMTWLCYWGVSRIIRGNELKTPDLRGKSFNEAAKWLGNDKAMRAANLSLKWEREQPSDTVDEGYIISQYPEPKDSIKNGSSIRVVVSGGIALVTLPDVRRSPQNRAQFQLKKAGLEVGNRTLLPSTSDPVGTVLETDPPAGTGVPQGSKVNMLVATGQTRQSRVMPNLQGMALDQAREVLTQAGLFATEIKVTAPGVPGQVVSQSPAAGESMTDSTPITIKYSPPLAEEREEDAPVGDAAGQTEINPADFEPTDPGNIPAVKLPEADGSPGVAAEN